MTTVYSSVLSPPIKIKWEVDEHLIKSDSTLYFLKRKLSKVLTLLESK